MVGDYRLSVGSTVYTKLTPRVLNPVEAHRRFGSRAETTMVEGNVLEVRIKSLKGRKYRHIYGVWSVQGTKKRVEVPLSAFKIGPGMFAKNGITDREIEIPYPIIDAISEGEGDDEQTPLRSPLTRHSSLETPTDTVQRDENNLDSGHSHLDDSPSTPIGRGTGNVELPHTMHSDVTSASAAPH